MLSHTVIKFRHCAVAQAVDAIALVDMLQSFAAAAMNEDNKFQWCKPDFKKLGKTEIVEAWRTYRA